MNEERESPQGSPTPEPEPAPEPEPLTDLHDIRQTPTSGGREETRVSDTVEPPPSQPRPTDGQTDD